MAQIEISGTVKSNTGEFLTGASVVVLDKNQAQTKKGTVVESTGVFKSTVDNQIAGFVQITYAGYLPTTLPVPNNGSGINFGEIVLEPKGTLQEAVVTAKKATTVKGVTVKGVTQPAVGLGQISANVVPTTVTLATKVAPPSPVGLESFVLTTARKLGDLENKIDSIFTKYVEDPLIALNEVDICNIVNYYLSKVKVSSIKDPSIKAKIDQVKLSAYNLNQAIVDYTSFTTVANTPRNSTTTVKAGSNTNKEAEKQKLLNLLNNLKELGLGALSEIPPEVLSVVPVLGKARSTVEDITSIFSGYQSIDSIPNSSFQKLINKVYDLQAILGAIASIGSAQGLVNLLGLQDQIAKLQKYLDPARILPTVKKILQIIRNINQIGLQVLKILSFAKIIVKIITVLIKVFRLIVQLFKTLPLPNLFTVHGVTATLEEAKEFVKANTTKAQKFLEQVNRLLALVYEFTTYLLDKVQRVTTQLEILIVNIEACASIAETPFLVEARTGIGSLRGTYDRLVEFATRYNNTISDSQNKLKIPGFTLTVIEEELVDEGRMFKRRRAVAYNDNGLLVAEGDLTFATNNAILLQELKLKLQQEGIIKNSDTVLSYNDQLLLDETSSILGIDAEEVAVDSPTASDMVEMQADLDSFITGLKDGAKLKKKAKKKVSERITQFKQDVKKEGGGNVGSSISNSLPQLGNEPPSPAKNLLSENERKTLKSIITAATFNPSFALRQAADKARKKLEDDDKARAELIGG